MSKSKKISWDSETRIKLASNIVEIRVANPELSLLECLRHAQLAILPMQEQRVITALSQVSWLPSAVTEAHQAHVFAECKQVFEGVTPDLSQATTYDLVHALVPRTRNLGALSSAFPCCLPPEPDSNIKIMRPRVVERVRHRRLVIIGLLPIQVSEIKRAYKDQPIEFVFHESWSRNLRSSVVTAAAVLVTRFVRHSSFDAVDDYCRNNSIKLRWGVQGLSELKSHINHFLS